MKKIYLAIPYTPDPIMSFYEANKKAAELMHKGHVVFSPISHSHPIHEQVHGTHLQTPATHDFWVNGQDKYFIDWCDELRVIMLPGWDKSIGVAMEIKYAKKLGKEIRFEPV